MAVGSAMAGEATGGGGLQPHNGQATTLLTAGWKMQGQPEKSTKESSSPTNLPPARRDSKGVSGW